MEITNKKLIVAIGLLFALGVALAYSNAYCAVNMGHMFAPLLYGIALIALATGGAVALLFQWKVDRIQLEKVISILPDDEKKVLKIIIDKKSISQTELKYLSELSKVKVSRVVSKLEQRNIIEKKPYGNTNLIIRKI
ncbi:hypothetical protein HOD29_01460 [archaeon]|jgi:uncharacterized membrane protein|nr:hypothetical protein [archaeon]MBT7903628.1 hypothetical protein [Candidatus Woesearchaeota archaeon]MBT4376022.1 hypothetical protein [archaeon]MBT4669977.1 hypothetical protein [archaeon]MBT5287444.1 hypothetical protein [archaeon]